MTTEEKRSRAAGWTAALWLLNGDKRTVPASCGPAKIGYCYPDNFTRLERATELAAARGITVPQVCMAYTMSGPLTVLPIIGAANREELASTLSTMEIKLSRAECDYIDLTSDVRPF